MCIPCGPRWNGPSGRPAFQTLDDCSSSIFLAEAKEKYPDNEKAVEEIKEFIVQNIDHTEKWIIDRAVNTKNLLAYIWAEEDNRVILHKFYLAEKRKTKA